jgi:hypothetical protein
LRGAELRGAVDIVGEVPRTGTPDARLAEPERLYARKYNGSGAMRHTGHHAWLRLVPDKITSWDFRKKAAIEGDAFDFG